MTEQKFNHIILPLAKNIYSYALHLLKNEEDAADVTQDIMVKSWEQRNKFEKISNPKAWLLKMTRNLCIDRLNKKSPIFDTQQVAENNPYTPNLQQEIESRDMVERVEKILKTLPLQQQEVFILREMEQLAFDEIFQITNLTPNHIRVLLSRARKTIREKLYIHS